MQEVVYTFTMYLGHFMFHYGANTALCKWSNRVHTVRGFRLVCFPAWEKSLCIPWCLLIGAALAPGWIDSPVYTANVQED
jgi:hypothetical protein